MKLKPNRQKHNHCMQSTWPEVEEIEGECIEQRVLWHFLYFEEWLKFEMHI